jgi:hypothetical protein
VNKTLLFPVKQQPSALRFTKRFFPLLAILIVSGAGLARASLITYQDQVIATGILDGSSFTNALVTVSITADTNNVLPGGSQLWFNKGTTTVTVAGLGTDTFIETGQAFTDLHGDSNSPRCGISLPEGSLMDTGDSDCGTYDLKTPITVTGLFYGLPDVFATDLGTFQITSVEGNSTFTATLVPEPSSISLLGLGIALFAGFNRPRKR